MLKQITDKGTLLALLKADKPIAFAGVDEDGGLYTGDFNDAINTMFKVAYIQLLADFEDEPDDEPSDSVEEPEPKKTQSKTYTSAGETFVKMDDAPKEAKDAPEKPADTAKRGPKPIDKGKVKALLQAGWTDIDIADEMDCTEKRIENFRLKMKERGEL